MAKVCIIDLTRAAVFLFGTIKESSYTLTDIQISQSRKTDMNSPSDLSLSLHC